MNTIDRIKSQLENNTVVLYMKGTPQFPMCGFSARVVESLSNLKAKYSFVNVLENPDIRAELPKYADWPTFPQLYINKELIGGCDIVMELFSNGDLEKLLQAANATNADTGSEFSVA